MKLLKGKRGFLFGNEAIVRGALESGVGYAATYPGTPASEIGDNFASIAKEREIYFEYSVNEKVALEGAAGAAFSGIKAIVSFKHYGLNVALDSLLPLAYLNCPIVVVAADDPGCWSSIQTEQDCRFLSKLMHIPTLDPSDPQEAKDMTKFAFWLAWKYKIPVLIRPTTRVCYSRSIVKFGKIKKGKTKGKFEKGFFRLGAEPTVERHKKLLEKLREIEKISNNSWPNFVKKGVGNIGIITSGVAYNYVLEALEKLKADLPILKLGFIYPFPFEKARKFTKKLKKVIIIEELEPILEEEIKKIFFGKIYGKNLFQETGELKPEHVLIGISQVLGKSIDKEIEENIKNFDKIEERNPFFCAGCPHRNTFYAVKKTLGMKKIFAGDIGCYMLGAYAPYKMQDFVVSMGASLGIGHGISKVSEKPIIFIGDSTFFHAGIPALLNLVYNKANALVIVLDNRLTAMTGHQPHPGSGFTGMGEETKKIEIEEIAKACKVDFVRVSNVYNLKQLFKDIREANKVNGVAIIVARGECRLSFVRNAARAGKKIPKFEIIKQDPKLEELKNFGCPAIQKIKGKWTIDKNLCWGCSSCKQLFPEFINEKF